METTIALTLTTFAAAAMLLLAVALPPHGEASASGYGIDATNGVAVKAVRVASR